MPWETRATSANRYYTRTVHRNGRRIKEYLGRGPLAEVVAARDALRRDTREQERAERRAQEAELQEAVPPVAELCRTLDAVFEAALLAAGFHRPARGVWRKRREATAAAGDTCNQGEDSARAASEIEGDGVIDRD